MPNLTILPKGDVVAFTEGASLLALLREAGAPVGSRCGGNLSCGSCHVFVQEGRKSVSRTGPGENALLDGIPGVGSKSRLACQVRLGAEDVSVELLSFSSGR